MDRDVMLCVGKRELIEMIRGHLGDLGASEEEEEDADERPGPPSGGMDERLVEDLVRMEVDASTRSRHNSTAVPGPLDAAVVGQEESDLPGAGARDWKAEMVDIYLANGMSGHVPDIDRLLVKYHGREQDLIDKMIAKYAPKETFESQFG